MEDWGGGGGGGGGGLAAPQVLAPSLDDFASKFCITLRDTRANDEKDSAFQGFCHIVQRNPNGLVKHIANFTLTVAKYEDPSPQLMDMFKKVKIENLDPWLTGIDAHRIQKRNDQLGSIFHNLTPGLSAESAQSLSFIIMVGCRIVFGISQRR